MMLSCKVAAASSCKHTNDLNGHLQAIGTSARKHLVDAKHMEGVRPHTQVEGIFARVLDHVLVGSDARRLQRFTAYLLLLPAAT